MDKLRQSGNGIHGTDPDKHLLFNSIAHHEMPDSRAELHCY
jgi:hypothetical protein